MKRISFAALVSIAALAGACSHAQAAPAAHTERFCSGLTDTCQTVTIKPGEQFATTAGRISDVSSFQGHPNWAAAKRAGIAGGIFKGGEFTIDPTAAFNAAALRAVHLWHAMYWFVRNTGCARESAQIIAAARAFGVVVVINDLEVREAAGYGACLVPRERAAHLIPVDYTAPGTFPGGGFGLVPLWQAEFGPTLHPFWHPVVAWQCTDGVHGCVTFVPGIGVDDVSINLGITKLGAPTPKPPPPPAPPTTWQRAFGIGFQRGFDVAWLQRHRQSVPPFRVRIPARLHGAFNVGFNSGYRAGHRAR